MSAFFSKPRKYLCKGCVLFVQDVTNVVHHLTGPFRNCAGSLLTDISA